MASKKKTLYKEDYGTPPAKLEGMQFYGLELNEEQRVLRDAIWNPDIDMVMVNAPAGTGKTFVTLGTANMMYQYKRYDKIIYMMAATQQEKLGHLPGSSSEKLAPYFLPLYDAAQAIGLNPYTDINPCTDDWQSNGDGFIDCMSPNFLRGRNIDAGTILIVDESQNFYLDELKTILTRVHDGAKCIVIGHTGQCDLFKHPERSGFAPYIEHFKDKERCQVCELHTNHRGWISLHADLL